VGHTGAGKSTIARLLLRLYDADSGSVNVNGANIKDVQMKSLRDQIGVCAQQVWEAARGAALDEFIMSLPEKLDTVGMFHIRQDGLSGPYLYDCIGGIDFVIKRSCRFAICLLSVFM
jgi:ABC-type bacteriocin/lantibiotic exporter with double-glycine peptidase domain